MLPKTTYDLMHSMLKITLPINSLNIIKVVEVLFILSSCLLSIMLTNEYTILLRHSGIDLTHLSINLRAICYKNDLCPLNTERFIALLSVCFNTFIPKGIMQNNVMTRTHSKQAFYAESNLHTAIPFLHQYDCVKLFTHAYIVWFS